MYCKTIEYHKNEYDYLHSKNIQVYFCVHNESTHIVFGILKQTFNTTWTGGQDFPKEDFMT